MRRFLTKTNVLTLLILAALLLGALVGEIFLYDPAATPEQAEQATGGWRVAGDLVLIRPLQLIALPIIFTSVLTGITSIGSTRKLGVLGGATILFYVVTMIFAVGLGVTLGALIQPGAGIPPELQQAALQAGEAQLQGVQAPEGEGLGAAWLGILRLMIPSNFFEALATFEPLSIITATIALGVGLLLAGEKGKPFIEVVVSLHEALMILIRAILWLIPLGVFFLVAWAVGTMGLRNLGSAVGVYVVAVIAGLGTHMLVTLPLVLWLLVRINPYKYLWQIRQALLMAFGTASSLATLPITIETTRDYGGCSSRASGLVLPLGATINMDGTALYLGVAVIFLFQAFGYDLAFPQYLVIVLTATLAAVGAAGVPGGSLVTMLIIIAAVNQTLAGVTIAGEQIPPLPLAAIGLIIGVDRILDMTRTMVNVWGDSVGARVITRLAPDIEEEREAAFA
jgi:Na+/H+-dicarboxylate symporter